MLNQRTYIEDKIKGLSRLIPTLKVMKHEAEELVGTINGISESSEKISSKIRNLDSARVKILFGPCTLLLQLWHLSGACGPMSGTS